MCEIRLMQSSLRLFFSERLIVENFGLALEETVDVATPLGEERAATKIDSMGLQRSPDYCKHVAFGLFDAARDVRGDAARVLTNHIQPAKNGLTKLVLFASYGMKYGNLCYHEKYPPSV